MVVIMLVPIMIGVPAVGIFVPPAVLVFITVGAGFGKLVTPVFGLCALRTMMLDGLMKLVVCPDDAFLTILVRANNRRSDKKKGSGKRRGSKRVTNPLHFESHLFSIDEILAAPRWEERHGGLTQVIC